jgi:hypothetical protein
MITLSVAVLLALPPVVLRRRTLAACYAAYAVTWLFAWILFRRLPEVDARLGFVCIAVVNLLTFSVLLANGKEVRWSAMRAFVIAALVYAAVIPAMLYRPMDGDEPYYLLITESVVRDADLDLANQYRQKNTASGRANLVPQTGDPKGAGGEQYSRHEPFLPLLMAPGYALFGLYGAIGTIALFGALLARSTVRWMEDEGIGEEAIRAVFPLFAFAPPVLFYATRIWAEVPAAFCFVEALRGVRDRRAQRWLPALLGLVLLKVRFVLVAAGLVAVMLRERTLRRRTIRIALGVLALPMLVAFVIVGNPLQVHRWSELVPSAPMDYARGLFGFLADGAGGIAFRAPFYLLGSFALVRWRAAPRGFRIGILASLLYLLYLLPRGEAFANWGPPLRYLVFLMPVLALGAASVWSRVSQGAIALIGAWTAALVVHGLTYPWRLFHEANGENHIGEWFSRLYSFDFSRFFPSFVRVNNAAWIGAAVVIVLVTIGLRRWKIDLIVPVFALAIAGTLYATQWHAPAVVHFEDAHVRHHGGELYPPPFTEYRIQYRGGWVLEAGDELSANVLNGKWTLHYISGPGATIEVGERAYHLPPTDRYATARIEVTRGFTLRVLSGSVNVDRMEHAGHD